MRPLCCAALFAVGLLAPAVAAPPAKEIFAPYNEKRFTALAKESAETYFAAEEAYKAGEFQTANKTLNQFWKVHPPGTDKWEKAYGDADGFAKTTGANFGSPLGYYALRMLTDCAKWRAPKKNKGPDKPATVTFTVLLVGKSAGVQPRTVAEFNNKGGIAVENAIDPRLAENDHAVMRQSMWLFQEYVNAITDGKLAVKVEFLPLPQLTVPVKAHAKPFRYAGLGDKATDMVFAAVPAEVRRRTDWWLLVYPSHVPKAAPFASTEFITGGIGGGPDGRTPLFMVDDLWFVRKPPHLGRGDYTEFERRLYLPQWFQHEFFHHLFATYPAFKLEAKDHQWFDRKTWPADFAGTQEPDYYHEALHKRLKTPQAQPPLELALRYAGPPDAVLKKLTPEALVGTYVRSPRENDYHEGTIEAAAKKKGPALVWTNKAGVSWGLTPDLAAGVLKTGPDNPYFKDAPDDAARAFHLVLARDAAGEYLPEVTGFRFNGELYSRKK